MKVVSFSPVVTTFFLWGCRFCGAFTPHMSGTIAKLQIGSPSVSSAKHSSVLYPEWMVSKHDDSSSSTRLFMASSESDVSDAPPSWQFNPLFASLWIGFILFAVVGPGEVGDPKDTAMIMAYIDNPSNPGFSEAFLLIFNYLGIMPMVMACIAVPQAAQRGLPPLPFFVSSFALGYMAVGSYLSFRAPPRDGYVPSEASWFTRNVLESKLFGWGLVGGVLFLPYAVGLIDALSTDATATYQSFVDLWLSSKFVSASSVDSIILNIAAACLIPLDLKLRQPTIEDKQAKLVGASTLLIPFLGAALYCALRPALPKEEQENS